MFSIRMREFSWETAIDAINLSVSRVSLLVALLFAHFASPLTDPAVSRAHFSLANILLLQKLLSMLQTEIAGAQRALIELAEGFATLKELSVRRYSYFISPCMLIYDHLNYF